MSITRGVGSRVRLLLDINNGGQVLMRMKVFILASILMCIFVRWHVSIAYAEGADTLTIGENFVFNEIRAGKLSDYRLYEYWREKPGKIEICIIEFTKQL